MLLNNSFSSISCSTRMFKNFCFQVNKDHEVCNSIKTDIFSHHISQYLFEIQTVILHERSDCSSNIWDKINKYNYLPFYGLVVCQPKHWTAMHRALALHIQDKVTLLLCLWQLPSSKNWKPDLSIWKYTTPFNNLFFVRHTRTHNSSCYTYKNRQISLLHTQEEITLLDTHTRPFYSPLVGYSWTDNSPPLRSCNFL